jgi:hypothetical protein
MKKEIVMETENELDFHDQLSELFFTQEKEEEKKEEKVIEQIPEYSDINYVENISAKIIKAQLFEKYHYFHDSKYIVNIDMDLPIFNFYMVKTPKKFINKILNDIPLGFDNRVIASLNFYKMTLISTRGPYYYEYKFIREYHDNLNNILKNMGMNDIERVVILDEFLSTIDKIVLYKGNYRKARYGSMERYNYTCAVNYYFINVFDSGNLVNFNNPKNSIQNSIQNNLYIQELSIRGIGDIIYSRIKDMYIHVPEFEEPNLSAWAFYYLEYQIDMGGDTKKYWKLDYKFNSIVNNLIDNIENYCSNIFIKKYIELYGDREKRDFLDSNDERAIVCDLRQLYKNIKILSNKKSIYLELKNRMMNKLKYIPDKNDIFDSKYIDYEIEGEYSAIMSISEIQEKKVKSLFYKN